MRLRDGAEMDTTTLSFISAKGGAGKTLFSINAALELSYHGYVLLVDMDVFSCGLTQWFGNSLRDPSSPKPIATVSGLLECGHWPQPPADLYRRYIEDHGIAKVILPRAPYHVHVLPCYSSAGESISGAPHISRGLNDEATNVFEMVTYSLQMLASKYNCRFMVIDCHPGLISYVAPCCGISQLKLIVADFEDSTTVASMIFSAKIISNVISTTYPADRPKIEEGWHLIFNRAPRAATVDELRSKVFVAARIANDDALCRTHGHYKRHLIANFESPLCAIPDLEELRDDFREHPSLSVSRRGGNGLVCGVRYILWNLSRVLPDELPGIAEKKKEAAVKKFMSVYFRDRGLGRSGINFKWLLLSILATSCSALVILSNWKPLVYGAEIIITLFLLFSVFAMYSEVRKGRAAFDVFCVLSDLEDERISTKHLRYSEGPSPATTSAIWFPKACVVLLAIVSFLIAVDSGGLISWSFACISRYISDNLGNIANWATVLGTSAIVLLLALFTGLKEDLSFFMFSVWRAMRDRYF